MSTIFQLFFISIKKKNIHGKNSNTYTHTKMSPSQQSLPWLPWLELLIALSYFVFLHSIQHHITYYFPIWLIACLILLDGSFVHCCNNYRVKSDNCKGSTRLHPQGYTHIRLSFSKRKKIHANTKRQEFPDISQAPFSGAQDALCLWVMNLQGTFKILRSWESRHKFSEGSFIPHW